MLINKNGVDCNITTSVLISLLNIGIIKTPFFYNEDTMTENLKMEDLELQPSVAPVISMCLPSFLHCMFNWKLLQGFGKPYSRCKFEDLIYCNSALVSKLMINIEKGQMKTTKTCTLQTQTLLKMETICDKSEESNLQLYDGRLFLDG